MDWKTNYLPNYGKIWPETCSESEGFSCFSLFYFAFQTLVFEGIHIKNCGDYFNIVALFCSILVNPNLTFFDVNNNFELAIILRKVYFRTFFVSKWTNLTLIVLINTLLIFKHETLTYVLHIYQNTGSCWRRTLYFTVFLVFIGRACVHIL